MLPKPRRPREKRIVPVPRTAYSIAEYCEVAGLSRAKVLSLIDDGSLRIVKLGRRRLILLQ
jgi:excisionase family DNA binding protein